MNRTQRLAASRGAWLMLGGAFAAFTVSAGIMHSYAVFLVAFIEEFRWSRSETSIAYSVSQLVAGGSSPLVGAMVDKLGPRRLLLLGGSLLFIGLLGSALISALWQDVLLYGIIMTIGANCLGLVVFVPLLSRQFVRRRGMAISIVQSEPGSPAAPAPVAPAVPGWTLAEAVRTPHFWLLFAVYLFTGVGSFLVSLHQLAFAIDVGFDKLYAAGVLGIGSFLAIGGTIVTGTLSDYIGREWSAILAYGVSIVGVVCALLITSPDQHWLLWLHACFFGLTWGARGPAITAKTADLFPGSRLGTILGVITIGSGIGSAAGSWAAGWIFDLSGSYRLAFLLSIAAYVCGCIAFWALRRPPARSGHPIQPRSRSAVAPGQRI